MPATAAPPSPSLSACRASTQFCVAADLNLDSEQIICRTIAAWRKAPRPALSKRPAVFLLGATSGIVAAPCGAPAFAAVLTWVAATRSGFLGFVYLFVFSLGMTALLVGVGLFSSTVTALPRAGAWLAWVKKVAGVVLLGMAEYYFIQAGMVW